MAGRWSEYELRVRGHALETEELATLGAMGRVPCFPTRHYDGSVTRWVWCWWWCRAERGCGLRDRVHCPRPLPAAALRLGRRVPAGTGDVSWLVANVGPWPRWPVQNLCHCCVPAPDRCPLVTRLARVMVRTNWVLSSSCSFVFPSDGEQEIKLLLFSTTAFFHTGSINWGSSRFTKVI